MLTAEQVTPLVAAFEARTLPKSSWTHEAHLVVALHALRQMPEAAALEWVRANICAYNVSVGGENTDESGYHETITAFWVDAVRRVLDGLPADASLADQLAAVQLRCSDPALPLTVYSRDALFSRTARLTFIPPDLNSQR